MNRRVADKMMPQAEQARRAKELAKLGYTDAEIAFLVGPLDSGENTNA